MSDHDYAVHAYARSAFQTVFHGASSALNLAAAGSTLLGLPTAARELSAIGEMYDRAARTYDKPAFNLPTTLIDGSPVAVTETTVLERPYGNLVRFARGTDRNDPKLLLVAPMSGHYATLLRGTVEALLPNHDVHVTDWTNVRDVPARHGPFGLDEYARYVESFIDYLGPDCHVVAVCQPTVPVLAAIAQKAARGDAIQPLSMTLMGGPIDTRVAPTSVTKFADDHRIDWFRDHVVTRVPAGFPGEGQPVHAGHNQLLGFVWMNPDRHMTSHRQMFDHLRRGDGESADRIRRFYDEYLAVMDIHGRFYLDTVEQVFQRQTLARGEMVLNGEPVRPQTITRTALLTIEGEKDDISAPGQTFAAHSLCTGLPDRLRAHHLQAGAGHYGIFEGKRWRNEISPLITRFIRDQAPRAGVNYSPVSTTGGQNLTPLQPNFP